MATFLVAGRDGIGVCQRRKVFEMRNQYTLADDDGVPIGAVEQIGQSPFTFLARLFSDLDVSLPVTLAVTGIGGELAMRLHKPSFRFRVTVTGADGSLLGPYASAFDSVRQCSPSPTGLAIHRPAGVGELAFARLSGRRRLRPGGRLRHQEVARLADRDRHRCPTVTP